MKITDENEDNAYRDFDTSPEGRTMLERYNCRREGLKCDGKVMDSIHLAQNMDQRWDLVNVLVGLHNPHDA